MPDDNWYYGQAILPSRFQDDTVYVGGGGYEGASVYRSDDGGATFTAWADGLPSTLVYCLCEAPDGSGRIFAGTETSVYMRGQDDDAWTDVTDNTAPITTYWSCESLTAENTIRFATYGRGIWDLRLARSGDGLDRDGADLDRPAGEGEGEGEGQPAKDGGRTCGCAGGGTSSRWGLLLIAGLGLSRRRRAPAADRSATPAFP